MNIPGFTAEASVYSMRGHYRVLGSPGDLAGDRGMLQTVLSQATGTGSAQQIGLWGPWGPGGGWRCWFVYGCYICCNANFCWWVCGVGAKS
jgi:hypothetical protein